MNGVTIFSEAIKLVWRQKTIWLLGVLLGLSAVIAKVVWLFVKPVEMANIFTLDTELMLASNDALIADLSLRFLIIFIILFAYITIFWLIALFAEGSLIAVTNDFTTDSEIKLNEIFQCSRRMVRRFLGIDALVFLPWFIVSLLLLMLLLVIMLAGLWASLQNQGELAGPFAVWLSGLVCLFPFLLLLPILTGLTMMFRSLAFRAAMLGGASVWGSVRQTWALLRPHWAQVLLLFLILTGARILAGTIFQVGGWVFWGIGVGEYFLDSGVLVGAVLWLLRLVFTAIDAAVTTYLLAVTAVAWTMAYQQMTWSSNPERSLVGN